MFFSIFFEGLIWVLLLAVFAQSTKWISGLDREEVDFYAEKVRPGNILLMVQKSG